MLNIIPKAIKLEKIDENQAKTSGSLGNSTLTSFEIRFNFKPIVRQGSESKFFLEIEFEETSIKLTYSNSSVEEKSNPFETFNFDIVTIKFMFIVSSLENLK